MLAAFSGIAKNFKLRPQYFFIDNWIFRFHYRYTVLLYLVATVLVTSRQYIGEHIRCIHDKIIGNDKGDANHVMNTFCFFTSTFTVTKYYDADMVRSGMVAAPGVGPHNFQNNTEPIRRHAYYQWVPFMLFGQAIMFSLTHLLWKKLEGGRMRRLIQGVEYSAYSFLEREVKIGANTVPTTKQKEEYMEKIRRTFIDRILISDSWARGLVLCEVLNMLNVVLQILITNEFLGGHFFSLGVKVIDEGVENACTVLDEVFPKVTKCAFFKYGPSGSLQYHDAMCIMALNVINEKLYVFFWFWLIFMFCLSCISVLWRLITIVMHSRSSAFNKMVFSISYPGEMNPWDVLTVTNHCHFTDWLFLRYLSKNMDGIVFKELFIGLAHSIDEEENAPDDDESTPSLDKSSLINEKVEKLV